MWREKYNIWRNDVDWSLCKDREEIDQKIVDKMAELLDSSEKQIQQLQADRDELDVYKAYCLYQLGCLRIIGEKYNWGHVLSFSAWRKQQIECGYIKDNKIVKDSTQEG